MVIGALFVLLMVVGALTGKRHNRTSTASDKQGTSGSVSSATLPASQTSPRSHPARHVRCAGMSHTSHTSCAFARAVKRTYESHPSVRIVARSPVTGLTYAMHCSWSHGVAKCSGGNDAAVAWATLRTPVVAHPRPRPTSTAASTARPPTPNTPTTTSTAQPPTTSTAQPPPTPTVQAVEQPGSYDHSTDAGFCSAHQCIENFPNGRGYIVRCVDGMWSHSGGLSGACSDHGGET